MTTITLQNIPTTGHAGGLRHILKLGWTALGRDWRSGELRLLMLSLVIAVAAMTSVGFFVDRLRNGLERDAAQLLGADLVISSDVPINAALASEARARGIKVAETISFNSMALAGDAADPSTHLAGVKAVSEAYPLRGQLRTAAQLGVPDQAAADLPTPGTVWIDSALLPALGVKVGGTLQLGERSFTIARILTQEPDRGLAFSGIAPRVLMRLDELESTRLIQNGSRESRRMLFAASSPSSSSVAAVKSFRQWLEPQLARGQRVESLANGRPEVRAALDRAKQFLSLVALLTALLAAVAVALAARRFTARHLDSCAVMRCLGISQPTLLGMYLVEFTLIGMIGAVLGVVVGFVTHFVFIELLGPLVSTSGLPAPGLLPALQGFLVGFVLLIGFALPPVVQLRHVPPLRVLRREIGLPGNATTLGYGIGIALFGALLLWTAGDLKIGLMTAGGFAAAFVLFAVISFGAIKLVTVARHSLNMGVSLRFATAALERRPAATIVQTVALAIGLMALLLLSVTRSDLVSAWRKATPPDAPNRFVINIQPPQRDAFAKALRDAGLPKFDYAPMVRGRLVEINDKTIGPETYVDDGAKRLVEREFNLSYMDALPDNNRISAGKWFGTIEPSADVPKDGKDAVGELSMEEGIAKTLNVKMGDVLHFDIAGVPVSGRVTSLRKVEWDSMRINFFVIFPPAALATMPQTWLAAFHLMPEQLGVPNRLVQTFPNITLIDTGAILAQVQSILDQVVAAVEFLFVFTLAAGLLVLYAALLSSREERTREAALLRALGASRKQLSNAQFVEFIGIGSLAGLMAAAGAVAVGWALARFSFNFPYHFSVTPWLLGVFGGAAIAFIGGWVGLRPVLNQPPLATLREA